LAHQTLGWTTEGFVVATLDEVFGLSWSHRCVVGTKQGVTRIAVGKWMEQLGMGQKSVLKE